MRMVWMSLVSLALTFIVAAVLAADLDMGALERGEVIVEEVESTLGIPGVRASFMVLASRKTIWSTLLDYDNFPKFFKGIDRLVVLEQDVKGARVEFWINAVVMHLHYILYRHYAVPGHLLTWRRVSGDLEEIQGSWQIIDTDDPAKKLLIYASYVDIGFYPVTWIIRQGAKTKTEEMCNRLRQWLEKQN